MLALAIISTVILGLFIITMFVNAVNSYDDTIIFLVLLLLIGFVIMTIWVLYAR